MSVERAGWRLTGELASWFGVDASHIRVGDRTGLVNPDALDEQLGARSGAEVESLSGLIEVVNRSDRAVVAVVVKGREAFANGSVGQERNALVESQHDLACDL